jgi:thiol-disulfide isomerase/thioredoxin
MIRASSLLAGVATLSIVSTSMGVGPDEDALVILKAADQATKNVEAVSYQATRYGVGAASARIPRTKGEALFVKNFSNEYSPAMGAVKGTAYALNSADAKEFQVAFDGKTAYSLDNEKRTLTKGAASDGAFDLVGPGQALFMLEFAHDTPFQDEINAELADLEGQTLVGDVLCNVIYVEYGGQYGDSKARWFFGAEDNLPRKVERLMETNGRAGAVVTTLWNLQADPTYSASEFVIEAPEGYKVETYAAAKPDEPKLLAVGSKAPNWELKDPSGKVHTLSEYEGKIVLMDFWATWCGPCKKAMPGVQALHEKYADKGVVVLGINCWENEDGDPKGYMDEQGYTYGLLLGADKVAEDYKVPGIPTFYLIGPDGKVLHNSVGADPKAEEELSKIIDKALKRSGGA